MPTPLAHGVAATAAARTFRPDWRSWKTIALVFALASLPDVDFLPGMFIGDAGAFHRQATHSLFAAVVFSLPLAAVLVRYGAGLVRESRPESSQRPRLIAWYAFVAPVYLSHLLLDLVSLDIVDNSGLQLFWPFSNRYVSAPVPLPHALQSFFDLQFGPTAADFVRTLVSVRAIAVYFTEALLFTPLLLIPYVIGRARKRAREGDASASRDPVSPGSRAGDRRVPVQRAETASKAGGPA